MLSIDSHLVGNDGRALRRAIADPDRFAREPKVDAVRGLVIYGPEHTIKTRKGRRQRRGAIRNVARDGPHISSENALEFQASVATLKGHASPTTSR
jgi:hypothetical protein